MEKILKKRNIVFILFVFIATIFFMLKNNYIHWQIFKIINPYYMIVSLLLAMGVWTSEMLMLKSMLHKDMSIKDCIENVMLGQLFNGLTPFASGGQITQIYHMKSKKVSYAKATASLFIMFFIYQITLTSFGVFSIIFKYNFFKDLIKNRIYFIFLGFAINTCVALFLLSLLFLKQNSGKFMFFIIHTLPFLSKRKKDSMYRSVRLFIKEFNLSMQFIKQEKIIILKLVVLNIIKLFCMYTLTYFIILSVGKTIDKSIVIFGSAFLNMITSFVPLPGASLGAEGGFIVLFKPFFSKEILYLIMFLWRFFSYYLNILSGSLIVMYMIFRKHQNVYKDFI